MPTERHDPQENGGGKNPGTASPRRRSLWLALAGGCVLCLYAWIASSDLWQTGETHPESEYYNLLVDGFRSGHLSLATPVPRELTQLADPYDPVANEPYRLHDASYYQGKFYLYFGVTPALVLFLPYAAVTGQHLSQAQATMIFCAVGFLAGAAILLAVVRSYFPRASTAAIATSVLAVGLVNLVPVLLGRVDVYEVPIACGYACAMLTLLALWHAFHDEAARTRWLAAASLAYGLALGARPSLLPGAMILFLPVIFVATSQTPGDAKRRDWRRLLFAALAPIGGVGLALLAYNYLRFETPWEFGQHYQMEGVRLAALKLFSPDYFFVNVRMYFFAPLRWSGYFPFAQGIKVPPLPPGHLAVEGAFGALTNLPFLWLAGAALWLRPKAGAVVSARPLRWFLATVAVLFITSAAMLCLFAGTCDRYEVEFVPALALLAAIGLLALEAAATHPNRRHLVRGAGAILLLVSAATNWLASYKSGPEAQTVAGNIFAQAGNLPAAIREYERALGTEPDFAYAHHGLAFALAAAGRLPEAIAHFRAAVSSKPDFAEAHNGLGVALLRQHEPAAALREFEAAVRAAPRFAEAHFDCAVALLQLHRPAEAIPHFEATLRLKPNFPGARERLEAARRQVQSP